MKILKARNGIALMAVLVIMLITSLFIPVMFSMSDTSVSIAVKGTERQQASYLARSATEMCVAAFRKVDTKKTKGQGLSTAERTFMAEIDKLVNVENPAFDPYGSVTFETIYMLSKIESGVEDIQYVSGETAKEDLMEKSYNLIGEATCTVTYDGSVTYYQTFTDKQKPTEILKPNPAVDTVEEYKADLIDREKKYKELMKTFHEDVKGSDTVGYSYSKKENRNLNFTTVATTVNGINATRTCLLVMKTEPSEEGWLVFGIQGQSNTGGNQVFVDPDKATSVVPIKYSMEMQGYKIQNQPLLIYTAVGNMLIEPTNFKDVNKQVGTDGDTTVGVNNSQLVLGVQPGLNTSPNNDPNYKVIDSVNYDEQKSGVQYNNFVAFGATNAIKVGMPVNLLVNPCRGKRVGDGYYINYTPNASLFKIMIFQAPVIQFTGRTDMMMSFYERDERNGNAKARRMSSIILAAPESTPYSYFHPELKRTVKAGMVYFDADCYMWVIEYDDDGSSSAWTGALAETVYERDSDFQVYKIANAGDVYYFNAEVESKNKDTGEPEKTGLSLTGYFLETKYKTIEPDTTDWWNVWGNTKQNLFSQYLKAQENTYNPGDLLYIGNVNDQNTVFKAPEIDDYYTVWTN